ncbi:MAG: lytic transglycosylase domain-containing protein [Capnocytophaga sp.]|nr:lytic transglycosylase domain-containing protein [Capnocytophaga sp.]
MKNLMQNILSILGIFFLGGLLINASSTPADETPDNDEDRPVKGYNIYAVDLPTEISFAGEAAPLTIPDVRERLDRELLVNTYWQSNGLLLIKRANKYFPIIEPILKRNGIPDDFKYLALIESGFLNVVSPAGASGFWQFMKTAGKEYGLEITDTVDERYHLEKATQAACDYLNKAKQSTGNWTLAAAAYNAGIAGVNRQLSAQQSKDYYDLWLNTETSRYVFRILALKEIMSDPARYGFNYSQDQLYTEEPTYEVRVDSSIASLADFAKLYGINYKELKIHNPWLRDTKLTNTSGKIYYIKIPKK